jgi:large subunit ribosomal protein L10
MPNATKIERVAELKEQIESANALLLTEYRGLTVEEITELRRSLRDVDASLAVIKNTLMTRAANDAGIAELDELLSGPSAVAFVNGDVVAVAKKLKDASKQYPALVIKGGFMDGAALDAAGASALADLESREVMLSKIAGMLKSEMSRAAAMFVATQSKFLSLLEAYKEKLPAEAAAEEAPAEAPAKEAATEAPAEEAAAEAPTEAEASDAAADEPAAEAAADSKDEAEASAADGDESTQAPAEENEAAENEEEK